jgi:hypothetical protein
MKGCKWPCFLFACCRMSSTTPITKTYPTFLPVVFNHSNPIINHQFRIAFLTALSGWVACMALANVGSDKTNE